MAESEPGFLIKLAKEELAKETMSKKDKKTKLEKAEKVVTANGKKPIPWATLDDFIYALRDHLRGDDEDNNLLRFLYEKHRVIAKDEKAIPEIEKRKSYLPSPITIGLLAIYNVIKEYYDVCNTYDGIWEETEAASEIEFSVDFRKTIITYEHGVIELINKKSGAPLTLYLNTDTNRPHFKIYSFKGNGETAKFITRFNTSVEKNNLYKNKTFTMDSSSGAMVPKFIHRTQVSAKDVIIPSEIADIIQANVIDIFLRSNEYKASKIPLKRGVLLEGPPGNGKSTIVKYVETVLDGKVTFIYVTDGAIRGAFDITEIYKIARQFAPSVVVFEDIDTIGLSRQHGSNNFTSELLSQLDGLEALDGVVTIATTNFAELIDEALKNRPSRFDRRIRIPLPNSGLRKAMLANFLKDKDVEVESSDINLDELCDDKLTKNFSGAMLKEVVITAKMVMIQDNLEIVNNDTLKKAIDFIKKNFHDSKEVSYNENSRMGFRGIVQ